MALWPIGLFGCYGSQFKKVVLIQGYLIVCSVCLHKYSVVIDTVSNYTVLEIGRIVTCGPVTCMVSYFGRRTFMEAPENVSHY